MKLTRRQTINLVIGLILIVVGILMACSILMQDMVSILLGVVFLVSGSVLILQPLIVKNRLLDYNALLGGIFVSLGVLVLLSGQAIIMMIAELVCIISMVIGIILAIDSLLYYFLKKKDIKVLIIELLLGVVLFVVGLVFYLMLSDVMDYVWMVLGILFALYGIWLIVKIFIKEKNA